MALEDFMKLSILRHKFMVSFFLGILYSIIGIFSAKLIFGSNPDMMSVAFVSLLLIPAVNRILKVEEDIEARDQKFSFKGLFSEHSDIFLIYIFLFFGIFFTFLFFSVFSPESTVFYLFKSQLNVAGITGQATAGSAISPAFFSSLMANNLKVLFVCLILSLVYGAGSILFITWNASVWGVVFGYSIKMGAIVEGQNPLITFLVIMIPVLPHLFTEALSYFSAAIAGGVMSKAVVKEEWFSKRFNHVATDSLILFGLAIFFVILAALLEARF